MATSDNIEKIISSNNLKKEYGKLHDKVINVSEETVEFTVENIEKWQKLFSKTFTATTPIIENGIDLTFEVAEKIFDQYKSGGQRMKSLLGWKETNIQLKNKVTKNVDKAIAKAVKKTSKATKSVNKKVKTVEAKIALKSPSKLTDISGIGPKIAGLLKAAGIKNIDDLSKAPLTTLNKVLENAGPKFQMHNTKTWVSQAQSILKA